VRRRITALSTRFPHSAIRRARIAACPKLLHSCRRARSRCGQGIPQFAEIASDLKEAPAKIAIAKGRME